MVTASSTMARAVESARQLIAASPTFRTMVGAADKTAALISIYVYSFEEYETTPAEARPFAVIGLDPETIFQPINFKAAQVYMNMSGGVWVVIQDNVISENVNESTSVDSYVNFLNNLGGLCDDMSGRFFGDEDEIGFKGIQLLIEPERTPRDERAQDDYWAAGMMFEINQGI